MQFLIDKHTPEISPGFLLSFQESHISGELIAIRGF